MNSLERKSFSSCLLLRAIYGSVAVLSGLSQCGLFVLVGVTSSHELVGKKVVQFVSLSRDSTCV